MTTRKISSSYIGLLLFLSFALACIIFFSSYETNSAHLSPSQENSSSQAYPPPPDVPYPPPVTQSPIPTTTMAIPTPTPTGNLEIPIDTSFEQAAINYVAQNLKINPSSLSFVENSTIVIPITEKRLWNGVIVDHKGKGNFVYKVIIDEGKRVILSGTDINPQQYWDEAETLFRKANYDIILSQVSQISKTPVEELTIVNGVLNNYPLTKAIVWHGKILSRDGDIFEHAVTIDGKHADLRNIEVKEFEARGRKFGKLSEDLYYLLQAASDDMILDVALWTITEDPSSISEKLKTDFPEISAKYFSDGIPVDSKGKPVKVEKEKLKVIQDKYKYYLQESATESTLTIINNLKELGYKPIEIVGLPIINVRLSKKDINIVNLLPWDNLTSIFLNNVDPQSNATMEVANGTIRTSVAWNAGYTGTLFNIGIADAGVITTNPYHPALFQKIKENKENLSNNTHAGYVTGVIVGEDDNHLYRGVSYGNSNIYSAKIDALVEDLTWLTDRTSLVNASVSFDASRNMLVSDRVFDYFSRSRNILFVIAAGNEAGQGWNVTSPAKSYNSLSVGAFNSHDDISWNDTMADFSCWSDPYIDGQTTSGDREKPEVAAVGVGVEVPNVETGGYDFVNGTSVAAPQVTGLANLLMFRDWDLRFYPPTVKAIIMASAVNNIEGDERLSERDGAGGIDVATAFSIFDSGGYMNIVWPDVNQIFPSNGSFITYDSWDMSSGSLYAASGQRIRAVISWESNPNSVYTADSLSTDLDLTIIDPSGNAATSSVSINNNYEIVDFVAQETGNYKVRVRAFKRSPESPNLGLGLSWIRLRQYYLPIVFK